MARKRTPPFDPQTFLTKVGNGKTSVTSPKKHTIFRKGAAEAVFYLQAGRIKLTVVSKRGKEAVVAILRRELLFGGRLPRRRDSSCGDCDRLGRLQSRADRQRCHDPHAV